MRATASCYFKKWWVGISNLGTPTPQTGSVRTTPKKGTLCQLRTSAALATRIRGPFDSWKPRSHKPGWLTKHPKSSQKHILGRPERASTLSFPVKHPKRVPSLRKRLAPSLSPHTRYPAKALAGARRQVLPVCTILPGLLELQPCCLVGASRDRSRCSVIILLFPRP